MSNKKMIDLTVGNPSSVLWAFCLPLFGSIIFQQLYNIADSLIAGRFIGENALAAVGNSYEITLIYLAFSFGCNIGCSIIVSFYYGAKDYINLKTTISTTIIASGILCAILVAFGLLFSGNLLHLINTPDNIFSDSKVYLLIYTAGFPFVMFYNIATGIFSALGDSKTPFMFLACSSVANIFMDIYFVAVLKMGVAGVGWATLICQGISCVTSLWVVWRNLRMISCSKKPPLFSFSILKQISQIAIPSILQQSFISIGNIIIQSVINQFGAGVIAGYAASVKLNNLFITALTTLSNGVSNYTSQNIGAKQLKRVREGFRAGIKMVWLLCVPILILYFFKGDLLIRAFMTDPTADAMKTGVIFLKILAPFYFVVASKLVADGVLKGAQLMKYFMIDTFTDLILRVVLAILFAKTSLGSTGIWMAWPFGWSIATALSIYFYYKGPWNQKTVISH
ncbi:MAG: MATE family efflux transporter [Eubacteriales bacterium]|nr:MATE family efflux transporter [Eubacteriales bacterium]